MYQPRQVQLFEAIVAVKLGGKHQKCKKVGYLSLMPKFCVCNILVDDVIPMPHVEQGRSIVRPIHPKKHTQAKLCSFYNGAKAYTPPPPTPQTFVGVRGVYIKQGGATSTQKRLQMKIRDLCSLS